jgi:hypothetical protein
VINNVPKKFKCVIKVGVENAQHHLKITIHPLLQRFLQPFASLLVDANSSLFTVAVKVLKGSLNCNSNRPSSPHIGRYSLLTLLKNNDIVNDMW